MTYQSRGSVKCLFCDSIAIGRKLCRKHYNIERNKGSLHNFPILGPEDVFDTRYKKLDSGCWEWTGTTNDYGYGIFLLPGEVPIRAHRFSYTRTYGQIPDGMVILHTCDNPPCVNPEHLRLGTKADNNKDTAIKRRHNYGLDHWNGRLSVDDILNIRNSDLKQTVLAQKYGVTPSHICRIKNHQSRK